MDEELATRKREREREIRTTSDKCCVAVLVEPASGVVCATNCHRFVDGPLHPSLSARPSLSLTQILFYNVHNSLHDGVVPVRGTG